MRNPANKKKLTNIDENITSLAEVTRPISLSKAIVNEERQSPIFPSVVRERRSMIEMKAQHNLSVELNQNMDRLGLAIVPLCRGTGAPFDEHRRPLAPSKFFDVCVTEKKSISYRCDPLPTALVVMITKLSLIGIPSKNSISL